MAERQWGQAETQDIGVTEVPDDAARYQCLHNFIGVRVAEGDVAAALAGIGRRHAFKSSGGSCGVEDVPKRR